MDIVKSKTDYRDYKYLELDNNIEVLFVHDEKATVSSVSLSVGCGSYDDPVAGCAHFLEHMLFMGNKKYPDEKYYSSFVNSHNGYCNAYTAGDHTNYYYTIDSNYLEKSLDIFSQFFISPLFDESCLSREMKAVHSEHEKNILDDNWRDFQIIKTICNQISPLSKFSTGNLDTLKLKNIRDILIDFFNKYYSANIMKLVILYSGKDFENIIIKTKEYFSQIKDKNVSIKRNNIDCHLNTNKYVKIIPVKDRDNVTLLFEINTNKNIKNNNLLNYVSYLIGHQGKNTLYDYLYKNGLIDSMFSSEECALENCSIFGIKFKLNNHTNIDDLVNAYFKYMLLLKDSLYDEKILDLLEEDRFINNQQFDNFEISEEGDFVSNISSNLINYDESRKYVLKYNYLIGEFLTKDKIIEELGNIIENLLDKSKFSLLDISKKYQENEVNFKTEKYYNIKYLEEELVLNNNSKFKGLLSFPNKNKYIVKNKEKINEETHEFPIKVGKHKFIDTYLKKDFIHNTTDCQIFIKVMKDNIYDSVSNKVKYIFLSELYSLYFNDVLFDVNNANFNVGVSINKSNYIITANGYYKKIVDIINIFLENFKKLTDPKIHDNEKFMKVRDNLLKKFRNKKYDSPFKKIFEYEDKLIYNKHIDDKDIEKEIEKINSYEDIIDINILNTNNILVYAEGNIKVETINDLTDLLNEKFIFEDKNYDNIVNLDIDKITSSIKEEIINENSEETNNCILVNYFLSNIYKSKNWMEDYANLLIFDLLISKEFFDSLRTKEQLGYIVKSNLGIMGVLDKQYSNYKFLVQSNIKDVDYLEERINKFVTEEINSIIKNLTEEELEEMKESTKEILLKPFSNLLDSFSFYFDKISNKNFMYNFNKIISSKIDDIHNKSIEQLYNKYFRNNTSIIIKIKKLNN
jgi:insulysin